MIIKKIMLALFFILAIDTTPAFAANRQWGVGAVIGDPTGLSVNYFLAENKTVNTVLAFDLDGRNEVEFFSHLIWRRKSVGNNQLPIGWFYGVGGKFIYLEDYDHNNPHHYDHYDDYDHDHDFLLGPSGTLGIFYEFEKEPLEVFLKTNLTMNVIQDTHVDLDVMLGLHFHF